MAYRDLRQFIEKLKEEGELNEVEAQVDWDLEIGGISRRAIDRRSGALLFNNIKDYPGSRIFANTIGPSKPVHGIFSLACGQDKEMPILDLIEWFGRMSNECIRPIVVDTAPCKENILKGEDIDLLKFPVPRIHGIDGGRFIGTWHIDVIKDPDTGWVNWGMYRHQLHDRNRIGWLAIPAAHGPSIYYQKYEARNKPMPMAICIGTDPLTAIVAGAGIPAQTNEVDVIGAMQGEPVQLVKCETIDLEVPASSEIVIEGYVNPNERYTEGPFGEFTGYAAGDQRPRPVFHAQCVTYRNNPIFTMSNMGKPWDETSIINSIVTSALLGQEIRKRGFPVRAIYCPPPTLAPIISAKSQYAGFIHSVASAVWGSKPGVYRPYIIMVGEDVDPTNLEEVFWCLTSRLHPANGIHVQKNAPANPLFPFISGPERAVWKGARVAFDATFPPDWPAEDVPTIMDFENGWPKETQDKVNSRWDQYGIR